MLPQSAADCALPGRYPAGCGTESLSANAGREVSGDPVNTTVTANKIKVSGILCASREIPVTRRTNAIGRKANIANAKQNAANRMT